MRAIRPEPIASEEVVEPPQLPSRALLERDRMPGGDEGIHLHASEAATVEDERLTPRVLDLHHLPQHEVVIPGRDRLHHRAAEDSCCTENDQEPVWAPADML